MNFITGPFAEQHGAATLGVRPEHLDIDAGGRGWKAVVAAIEYLGSDVYLHASLEAEQRIIVRAPVVRSTRSVSQFTSLRWVTGCTGSRPTELLFPYHTRDPLRSSFRIRAPSAWLA